jgi:cardiolipin synthase
MGIVTKPPQIPREDQRYFTMPDESTSGNRLVLLRDGREAYPAMLSAIAEAKQTVHLETYVLHDDKAGWAFAELLAQKARQAVQVRVIFDSIGSLDLSAEYVQYLRNHGAAVLEYHPVAPWRQRWSWGRRDHRKILVVDNRIGFTGGLNIANEYADPAQGGGGWRDTHVRIEGPAARELDQLFRTTWYKETGRWFDLAGRSESFAGASWVRVAANQEFLNRHYIRQAYLHALWHSVERVSIANAYFLPDRRIRRAFYAASRRGVQVRVLVPKISDVPLADYASRRRFEELLKNGVRLFEWPGPVLHAKTVVVDSVWSAVGSYNMDNRSWLHDLEVNLHILDRDFGRRMEETFEQDLVSSKEIRLDRWIRRPWQEKVLEHMASLFKYWL